MSIRGKVAAAAAALAIIAGAGVAGTQSANAETRSCGRPCVEISSAAYGTGYVLNAVNNNAATGTPVTLAPASGTDQAEDFTVHSVDRVSSYVDAGIIPEGMDPLYGNLFAFEIEFTPFGAPTNQCVGLCADTGILAAVTLQPCGVSAHTLWIFDPVTTAPGSPAALISGTTSSKFSNPVTLSAVLPGLPVTTSQLAAPPKSLQLWDGLNPGT